MALIDIGVTLLVFGGLAGVIFAKLNKRSPELINKIKRLFVRLFVRNKERFNSQEGIQSQDEVSRQVWNDRLSRL